MTGRRDPSEYRDIIAIVSYDARRNENRLNPIAGQAFPSYMKIECSKKIRALPIGTKVQLRVVEKNPKDELDSPHLYSSYKWSYSIVQ